MRAIAVRSTGTRASRRRTARLALLWGGFAVGTLGAALAVGYLYRTVQQELQRQGELALDQQQAKAVERIRARAEALRYATFRTLASFHLEGLAHALRQWDETDAAVVGTFIWDPEKGFLPGTTLPSSASLEALPALWAHGGEHASETSTKAPMERDGAYLTDGVSTVDNPVFPAGELGYQAENIDIVTYAGRVADPRGAWAARRTDVKAPWIFWYRLGPREQVRGCLLDATSLITQARGELADRALARIDLVAEKDLGVRRASSIKSLASTLPGYALQCDYGDLFVEKLGGARLALSAVALLLGLFVLGAAFLVVYSRRELRDAELKATFVTQVSHELRTPLTSIRMFADMLGAPDLALEKRAKFAGNISRESQRLSGLIERLLTFHTLERDQHAPEITRVEVVGVVRETMEEMDGTVRAAGMNTELDLPNEPVNALAEPSAIKQALLNLMENAIKYARDGGVIRILLKHDATNVRLRVADQGPGIAPPLRARVFEPFVQGGQMLTDKAPGLGLGLSIARGGLRQVGGDLVLLSSEKGACFEIQLPSAPVS